MAACRNGERLPYIFIPSDPTSGAAGLIGLGELGPEGGPVIPGWVPGRFGPTVVVEVSLHQPTHRGLLMFVWLDDS